MKNAVNKLEYNLIDYYLNSNPDSDQQLGKIIKEFYKDIKDKPKIKNISSYLIPKVGTYNLITAPVYMRLSTKYLRKINHRHPKQDDILALIHGEAFNS